MRPLTSLGMSSESAMESLRESGWVPMSDHEKVVRMYRQTFGMSEQAAEHAARGRDGGPSSRPVSESLAGLRPDPANIGTVLRKVEELATERRRGGASEGRALYEAAFAVMHAQPDERTADWVVRVVENRWPGLWGPSGTVYG
jgi:hypothetical protein